MHVYRNIYLPLHCFSLKKKKPISSLELAGLFQLAPSTVKTKLTPAPTKKKKKKKKEMMKTVLDPIRIRYYMYFINKT